MKSVSLCVNMAITGSASLTALESSTLCFEENDGNSSMMPPSRSDPREVALPFHLKGLVSFHVFSSAEMGLEQGQAL